MNFSHSWTMLTIPKCDECLLAYVPDPYFCPSISHGKMGQELLLSMLVWYIVPRLIQKHDHLACFRWLKNYLWIKVVHQLAFTIYCPKIILIDNIVFGRVAHSCDMFIKTKIRLKKTITFVICLLHYPNVLVGFIHNWQYFVHLLFGLQRLGFKDLVTYKNMYMYLHTII